MNRLKLNKGPEQQSGPMIISILSGKGGVGKSVIAFNLADLIASRGSKVLLVDNDLECGSIHLLANSCPEHGIADYLSGRLPLKDAAFAVNSELDILASADQGALTNSVDAGESARFAAVLRRDAARYDYAIIDHSSGRSAESIVIAQASDLNLLILVPEVMSVSDCYGLFKCLVKTNPTIDCRLLINRARDSEEAGHVGREFSELTRRFIGRAPASIGYLPESSDITKSVGSQKPLAAVCDPQSVVLQGLTELAREITAKGNRDAVLRNPVTKERINNWPIMADIKG